MSLGMLTERLPPLTRVSAHEHKAPPSGPIVEGHPNDLKALGFGDRA